MIIKNNFNDRTVNPLDDYKGIGKGSHNIDKEMEREKEGFIRENMNNSILNDLSNNENDIDDSNEDKWKFFR